MPRKSKTKLNEDNAHKSIMGEIYVDAFTVKNTSMKILKQLADNIDYDNKEEVFKTLPFVEKQMEVINKTNDVMLDITTRLNG